MSKPHASDPSVGALTSFGLAWLIAVAVATAAAVGANLVVGVPLGAVVDVVLALLLVALAAVEVYFAIRGIGFLLRGRGGEAMIWLGAMVVYLLLVFPPILAFDLYGYLTGQQVFGQSHLYDTMTGQIGAFFKFPAQLISAVLVLTLKGGSAYVNYVSQAKGWLEIGANVLSILVALQTIIASRRRKQEEAH